MKKPKKLTTLFITFLLVLSASFGTYTSAHTMEENMMGSNYCEIWPMMGSSFFQGFGNIWAATVLLVLLLVIILLFAAIRYLWVKGKSDARHHETEKFERK